MKALVLGGEGMLGHKMFQTVRRAHPETTCTLRMGKDHALYRRTGLFDEGDHLFGFDVERMDESLGRIRERKPDVVVNCVGIIKQRETAYDNAKCIAVNALWPHRLADAAAGWGGRVVHFSTDCVFSGNRGRYAEDDFSDAEDLYGRSKYLGELKDDNTLTLRTSIIGRELEHFKSLLEWLISMDGQRIRGFRKVIYSGVTTNHIAGRVVQLMQGGLTLSGLYQLTAPAIPKHELLTLLVEAYGLDIRIEPDDEVVSDRSMVGDRFYRETGYELPTWPALVQELADDDTPYDRWRTK